MIMLRIIRKLAGAGVIAGLLLTGGYVSMTHPWPASYAGCIYGGLHMKDGDVATSSVRGVDVKCNDGSIDRYIPGK
jgi:hypothetical protein